MEEYGQKRRPVAARGVVPAGPRMKGMAMACSEEEGEGRVGPRLAGQRRRALCPPRTLLPKGHQRIPAGGRVGGHAVGGATCRGARGDGQARRKRITMQSSAVRCSALRSGRRTCQCTRLSTVNVAVVVAKPSGTLKPQSPHRPHLPVHQHGRDEVEGNVDGERVHVRLQQYVCGRWWHTACARSAMLGCLAACDDVMMGCMASAC